MPPNLVDLDYFLFPSVAPQLETQPEDTDVLIRQSVLLNCSARGLPEPVITWTKNDEPLNFNDPRFQLLENGSLLLEDAMMNDAGDYKCIATNELDFRESDDAVLMVNSEYMSILYVYSSDFHSVISCLYFSSVSRICVNSC